MDENEKAALAAQAQADGAEAVSQETARDNQGWALNVRNAEANAGVNEAHALLDLSRAKVREALANTLNLVNALLLIGVVGLIVALATAAVQAIGRLL